MTLSVHKSLSPGRNYKPRQREITNGPGIGRRQGKRRLRPPLRRRQRLSENKRARHVQGHLLLLFLSLPWEPRANWELHVPQLHRKGRRPRRRSLKARGILGRLRLELRRHGGLPFQARLRRRTARRWMKHCFQTSKARLSSVG